MGYLDEIDDPQPDRVNEEQASRRVVFTLLAAGAAIAGLYGLGLALAAFAAGA